MSITSEGSGSNLNYLLDDEEPKRGGAGKYFVILLVLVLVGGLGYYRWSHGLAPWSIPREAKPLAAQDSASTDNTPPAGAPAASAPAQPADSSASTPAATPPAATAGTSSPTNPTTNSTTNPAAATPSAAQPTTSTADGSAATPPPDTPPASARRPSPARSEAPVARRPKPEPKPAAAIQSADRVAEAHKYLYGRDGTAQDCDRGLRLLKPLANGPNPKAMIEMGALYSAGLCTPHDLPTAYRWFAMALRQDPENQVAKTDLQKLWSEMTRPEQQLAIRLSQ